MVTKMCFHHGKPMAKISLPLGNMHRSQTFFPTSQELGTKEVCINVVVYIERHVHMYTQHTTQEPSPRTQEQRPRTQAPRAKSQEPRSKSQEPRSKTQDPRSKIQEPRAKVQEPRSKAQEQSQSCGRCQVLFSLSVRARIHSGRSNLTVPILAGMFFLS